MTTIRPIEAKDEAAWRSLWAGYCAFYETDVFGVVTDATWLRFFAAEAPLYGIVAETDGRVTGFATYVLHPYTWGVNPLCYLEDLFVGSDVRGRGIGNALIAHLFDLAKKEGWDRVYWHTRADNEVARRLYDRFVSADDFVRYRIDTSARSTTKALT